MGARRITLGLILTVALGASAFAPVSASASPSTTATYNCFNPDHPSVCPTFASNKYRYPYPSATDCQEESKYNTGCTVDKWNFFEGQCTSWVAYRLNRLSWDSPNATSPNPSKTDPFTNQYKNPPSSVGGKWGPADHWKTTAASVGVSVNSTPAPGAVAWYSFGHVAYVEQVNRDGSVWISEMNYDNHNSFDLDRIHPQNSTYSTPYRWPTGFIHVRDRGRSIQRSYWSAVGSANLSSGSSPIAFKVSLPTAGDGGNWSGAKSGRQGTWCDYTLWGEARLRIGPGYGFGFRTTWSSGIPTSRALQYDKGAGG
jgi:surface antigen